MKIALGFNIHEPCERKRVAIDSWLAMHDKYNVNLFDVRFVDDRTSHHDKINTLNCLNRDSSHVTKSTKRLPFVNDVLAQLCALNYDYFIFCNDDIIINENLIKHVVTNRPQCLACSRLDISTLNSYDQVIDRKVNPVRYEIAGFDLFVFKTTWYKQNQMLFNDYLVGEPCWDQVYATIMRIYGCGHAFGNKFPPFCFHQLHAPTWQNRDSVEKQFNMKQSQKPVDRLFLKIFDTYLKRHLIKRQPWGGFMNLLNDETSIESNYFNQVTCPITSA